MDSFSLGARRGIHGRGPVYALRPRFRDNGSAGLRRGGCEDAGPGAEPGVLIAELKDELVAVKRRSAEFEKKQEVLEDYEKTIRDRRRSLDRMIREVDKSIEDIRYSAGSLTTDDVYKRAMEMIGKGTPVDRVMKSLGIQEGEAELIFALNSYRH